MELSGNTWHVPPFITDTFSPLSIAGQIDWHASGFRPPMRPFEATLFGLLCVRLRGPHFVPIHFLARLVGPRMT